MSEENESSRQARNGAFALALSVGWELAVCTGLSFWLGFWLDGRFHTSPWGVLVSTLTGICIALYRLIRTFSGSQGKPSGRR